MIVAGIDAGGASWKLITANGPGEILSRSTIPTTTPDETIAAAADWINAQRAQGRAGLFAATFVTTGWGLKRSSPNTSALSS